MSAVPPWGFVAVAPGGGRGLFVGRGAGPPDSVLRSVPSRRWGEGGRWGQVSSVHCARVWDCGHPHGSFPTPNGEVPGCSGGAV
ncbi:hypothetical protein T261_4757 [Streptomyces lydicus]|nr:hypothetical protein T261_4757 [Streptomyces lydicus]